MEPSINTDALFKASIIVGDMDTGSARAAAEALVGIIQRQEIPSIFVCVRSGTNQSTQTFEVRVLRERNN